MKKTQLVNILIIVLIAWVAALFAFPSLRFGVNSLFSQLPWVGPWFERFTEPVIETFYTSPFINSFYPSILLTLLVVLLISTTLLSRGFRQLMAQMAQHKMNKRSKEEVRQHIKKDE